MQDMKKMLGKKDKKDDSGKKEAKLSALKSLRDEMSGMMKDDLGGKMNKVTVAAPDKASLEHGLDKAKEVLHEMPEEEAEGSSPFPDEEEESSEMESGLDNMSVEEVDAMMQKLAEIKKKLSGK